MWRRSASPLRACRQCPVARCRSTGVWLHDRGAPPRASETLMPFARIQAHTCGLAVGTEGRIERAVEGRRRRAAFHLSRRDSLNSRWPLGIVLAIGDLPLLIKRRPCRRSQSPRLRTKNSRSAKDLLSIQSGRLDLVSHCARPLTLIFSSVLDARMRSGCSGVIGTGVPDWWGAAGREQKAYIFAARDRPTRYRRIATLCLE